MAQMSRQDNLATASMKCGRLDVWHGDLASIWRKRCSRGNEESTGFRFILRTDRYSGFAFPPQLIAL